MNPNDTNPSTPTPDEEVNLSQNDDGLNNDLNSDKPTNDAVETDAVETPFSETNQASIETSFEKESPAPVNPTPIGGPAIVEKKKGKKVLIIIASALLIAGLTTAGYFVWQSLQPAAAPAGIEAGPDLPAADEPIETSSDVQAEIDAIQQDLDTLNDDAFSDTPITDESLNAAE